MTQEQKWIRAILRRNSRQAAEELIRAYYDEIYRYLYRQTGRREDAMDLTQETFVAMLRTLPAYDVKKAAFRTWLYAVATHKVIDARRKPAPLTIALEDLEPWTEDFAAQIQNQALMEKIEAFVSGLEPRIQEVYRLRLYGEYSFPEIARLTGRPQEQVKAQYYRLMRRLRKEFGCEEV